MNGLSAPAQFRKVALFSELTEHQLALVTSRCVVKRYSRGSEVISANDANTDVFFVLAGRVQVRNYAHNGREFIYSEISEGGMFGEFSAIDGEPRSASIMTVAETVVARITSSGFLSLLESDFSIAHRVLKLLTSKSRALTDRLLERSSLNMRARLHAELARLAAEGRRSGASITIQPAPTHYELAARVGSHREAITKELNQLASLGLIRVRRKQIVIVDMQRFNEDPAAFHC